MLRWTVICACLAIAYGYPGLVSEIVKPAPAELAPLKQAELTVPIENAEPKSAAQVAATGTPVQETIVPSEATPVAPSPAPKPLTPIDLRTLRAQIERNYRNQLLEIEFQLRRAEEQMEFEEEQRELAVKRKLEQALLQLEQAQGTGVALPALEQLKTEKFSATDLALDGNSERVGSSNSRRGYVPSIISPLSHPVHTIYRFDSPEHESEEHHRHFGRVNSHIHRHRPTKFGWDTDEHDSYEHHRHHGHVHRSPIRTRIVYDPVTKKETIRYEIDSNERESHEIHAHINQQNQREESIAPNQAAEIKESVASAAAPIEPVNEKIQEAVAEVPLEKPEEKVEETVAEVVPSRLNPNHELYSEEDEDTIDDEAGNQESSPVFFLFRKPDLNNDQEWSENRIDSGLMDSEFSREWRNSYDYLSKDLSNDMRVNRIFRTRNADFYNPDAEVFEPIYNSPEQRRRHPIK